MTEAAKDEGLALLYTASPCLALLYTGQTSVQKEQLDRFLTVATDLGMTLKHQVGEKLQWLAIDLSALAGDLVAVVGGEGERLPSSRDLPCLLSHCWPPCWLPSAAVPAPCCCCPPALAPPPSPASSALHCCVTLSSADDEMVHRGQMVQQAEHLEQKECGG